MVSPKWCLILRYTIIIWIINQWMIPLRSSWREELKNTVTELLTRVGHFFFIICSYHTRNARVNAGTASVTFLFHVDMLPTEASLAQTHSWVCLTSWSSWIAYWHHLCRATSVRTFWYECCWCVKTCKNDLRDTFSVSHSHQTSSLLCHYIFFSTKCLIYNMDCIAPRTLRVANCKYCVS